MLFGRLYGSAGELMAVGHHRWQTWYGLKKQLNMEKKNPSRVIYHKDISCDSRSLSNKVSGCQGSIAVKIFFHVLCPRWLLVAFETACRIQMTL